MNWRKLFAWLGAIAALALVLVWFSRPPGLEPGAIPVHHQPAAPEPKVNINTSNLFQWQSQEFTNRVLKFVDTNAPPRQEDQEGLDLQNMIIRQTGPRR